MNECACVYIDSHDGPEFCRNTILRARKEHKCYECGDTIKPGEEYEYTAGRWEGYFDAFHICLDCVSVRDSFFCDGYEYGGIWEYLGEHLRNLQGAVSSDCLISLTPHAREEVCEMIEREWKLLEEDEE